MDNGSYFNWDDDINWYDANWGDIKDLSAIEIFIRRGLPDGCVAVSAYEPPSSLTAMEARDYRERYSVLVLDPDTAEAVGGSGTVTSAYDLEGEKIALKRLRPLSLGAGVSAEEHAALCERRRAAFREEFVLMSRLSSFKQFPRIYGYGNIEGDPVILMEWIEGTSFEQLIEYERSLEDGVRFSAQDIAVLGCGLFGVLEVLEGRGKGFVHRDLSPANVIWRTSEVDAVAQMASRELDICLVDFGSSVLDVPLGGACGTTASSLRGTTAEYAPPEMLADDLPDVQAMRGSSKVDVYAACSILYEMLQGDTPFRLYDVGPCDCARFKADNAPCGESGSSSSAAEVLLGVFKCGLAAEQDMRPSAAAMRSALLGFLETCGDYDTTEVRRELPSPVSVRSLFPSERADDPSLIEPKRASVCNRGAIEMVFVDGFEPPQDLPEGQQREYRRRFAVLRLDASEPITQGPYRLQKAYTAENRSVAIVTYEPSGEAGNVSSLEIARAIAEKRLRARQNKFMKMSLYKRVPTVHGMGEVDGRLVLVEDWAEDV